MVKQDIVEIFLYRTGSQPWERQKVRGVSFPKGVAIAHVEVEAQESIEVKPNDWLRCRITVRRNCVDTDEQIELHMTEGWEMVRGECKRILEEEKRM